jgi:hypothetical protein
VRRLRPLPGQDLAYDWAHIGDEDHPDIEEYYLDTGNLDLNDMDERVLHLIALDIDLGLIVTRRTAWRWN